VVVESLGLAEAELPEYCRKKGLFVEQVLGWREASVLATAGAD
jgi:hypothetical protein